MEYIRSDSIEGITELVKFYKAHVEYGYTLKEIAEYYDVHYTTVSRAVQKI